MSGSTAFGAQTRIHSAISDRPPVPGAELVGWALVAEWTDPAGAKLLSRLGCRDSALWEFRGYMHEGLYGAWTAESLDAWSDNGR